MHKIVKITILILPMACNLYSESSRADSYSKNYSNNHSNSHAENDAESYIPSNMWQALLDAEKSHISVDDPLAPKKLRELIESNQNNEPFDERMYLPMRQLGILMQLDNDFEGSIDVFRQMQHLVHRHYGVYSPLQLESVDLLIESYGGINDFTNLDQQQHFRYRVLRQNFKPGENAYLAGTLQLADWYRNSMRYQAALALYVESNGLVTEEDTDLRIRMLRSEAMTYYLSGKCCVEEKLAEARLLALDTNLDREERKRVRMDYINSIFLTAPNTAAENLKALDLPDNLGPQLLGFRHSSEFMLVAIPRNRLLQSPSMQTTFVAEKGNNNFSLSETEPSPISLGSPIALCGETFDDLVRGHPDDLYADVTLTVDTKGQAKNVELTGNAPLKLMRYIRAALKKIRFRPAISKKGEITSGELAFHQTFDHKKADISNNSAVSRWSDLMVSHSCQWLTQL